MLRYVTIIIVLLLPREHSYSVGVKLVRYDITQVPGLLVWLHRDMIISMRNILVGIMA
jgi:hypothetical protein